MKWLTVEKVLKIHDRSLLESGGDPGVRDQGLLESAIAQPRARFDGKDLYPDIADKAVALAFSLVRNHPFVDGNKRVRVHGPRVTAVQRRTRRGSLRADPDARGPEATPCARRCRRTDAVRRGQGLSGLVGRVPTPLEEGG